MIRAVPQLTNKSKTKRGGKRKGAGRKKLLPDIAPIIERMEIASEARRHALVAIATLVDVAKNSTSDSARVSAAAVLLDRGYGKSPQAIEHSGKDGSPIELQHSFQTFAEALNKIALNKAK